MREKILAIIEEAGFGPADETSTFEALGMDSLDFICLINEMREHIGPISDEQARKMDKVGDLMEAFCSRIN